MEKTVEQLARYASLQGKRVFITGDGTRIGKSLVEKFGTAVSLLRHYRYLLAAGRNGRTGGRARGL